MLVAGGLIGRAELDVQPREGVIAEAKRSGFVSHTK